MPVPDFSVGEVLTAAAMDSIGLWKVGSVALTSGSTQNIVSCFSSDFTAYKLVISGARTNGTDAYTVQLLSGSTPVTGNYDRQRLYAQDTTVGGNRTSNQTSLIIGYSAANRYQSFSYDIFNPFLTTGTMFLGSQMYEDAGGINIDLTAGRHTLSNSYTGLRILCGANTFTAGVAMIYGYRN